jgi:hypothetical protein
LQKLSLKKEDRKSVILCKIKLRKNPVEFCEKKVFRKVFSPQLMLKTFDPLFALLLKEDRTKGEKGPLKEKGEEGGEEKAQEGEKEEERGQ